MKIPYWHLSRYRYNTKVEFEYDPVKSEANKQKHGIDFEGAKKLCLDANRAEFVARFSDEPRLGHRDLALSQDSMTNCEQPSTHCARIEHESYL